MQTTYLKESLLFDQASSEVHNLIFRLRDKRSAAENAARQSGEETPRFYDLLIADLKDLGRKYDEESNRLFAMHRESADLDGDGINNLLVAMVSSWAEDYEHAISRKDDQETKRLLKEAENFVSDTIVNRIDRTHKAFAETAHKKVAEIVEDTDNAKKHRTPRGTTQHKGDWVRNYCPLCGGGLYAVRASKDSYKVKCTSCNLFEVVRVENER